jgi:hypothetical protein
MAVSLACVGLSDALCYIADFARTGDGRIAMKGLRFVALLLLSIGFDRIAAAAGIDINVNNDAALIRYLAYDGRAGGFGKREMDAGLLFNSDKDFIAMFGAQVIAEAGSASPGLEAGVGLKFFRARSGGNDAFTLALGGQLKYAFPPYQRFIVGADGFYGPRVLTFMDARSYSYVDVYAGYEVLPKALVYVGYRESRADIEHHGNVLMEHGGNVGLRFEF